MNCGALVNIGCPGDFYEMGGWAEAVHVRDCPETHT